MAETQTRPFPLRTILSVMHANTIGGRGIDKTGVTVADGMELMRHMYPGIRVAPSDQRHYLGFQFAALLRKRYPHFAQVSFAKVTQQNFDDWMGVQELEFGEMIDVPVVGKYR